jgi:hypothetical protein
MSQVRQKSERVGEIAARTVVQLLFSTGKSFTVDGLREKLREFFRQEVRPELRAVAALNNVELIRERQKVGGGVSHARHFKIAQSASGAHNYCYRRGTGRLDPRLLDALLNAPS